MALSLAIGLRCNPESAIFKYHMPLGCVAAWFLLVRVALGFCGAPLSRWRAMFHSPRVTIRYFLAALRGRTDEPQGLNPGTAVFAPLLFIGVIATIATGFIAEWVEVAHGPLAWALAILIGFHLLGLLWHALRHRAATPLAMIHGQRSHLHQAESATSRRWTAGVLVLAVGAFLAWSVWHGFEPDLGEWRIPAIGEVSFPLIQKG